MLVQLFKMSVCGLIGLALGTPSVAGREPVETAESFLSFEAKIDGKCHNLSEGGNLQVMRNLHPVREIKFRLIRYFVDVRQHGRATGIAKPGETVKIGCTAVAGRPQRWVVERAEFITENEE
ncbi:MAG: hypothetical protein VCB07_04635 [Gammaproteobacteria bacterium]